MPFAEVARNVADFPNPLVWAGAHKARAIHDLANILTQAPVQARGNSGTNWVRRGGPCFCWTNGCRRNRATCLLAVPPSDI